MRRHLLPHQSPHPSRLSSPPRTTSATAVAGMAHAAASRVLRVGVNPAPMVGVVAVKAGAKGVADGVAEDVANAPGQASATVWTQTASRPPMTA